MVWYSMETECAICLERLTADVNNSVLKCKHSFHTSCLLKLMHHCTKTTQSSIQCPDARKSSKTTFPAWREEFSPTALGPRTTDPLGLFKPKIYSP